MSDSLTLLTALLHCFRTTHIALLELGRLVLLAARSRSALAAENPSWGEERIANELKLKLGVRVSPRTVWKYLSSGGPRREPDLKQHWLTLVRNHAKVIVDRAAVPGGAAGYRFVIHHRDSNFSQELDQSVTPMGVRALRTPVRAPRANSVRKRFGGTLRRECLGFVIPCNDRRLKLILRSCMRHFNHGRPRMSLGPGIPAPVYPSPPESTDRHRIPAGHVIRSKPIPGGLHHEYSLQNVVA